MFSPCRPFGLAAVLAAGLLYGGGAAARDLTVVSWGGAYQDAQKKVYFEPFTAATKIPLTDESWDGGIGVLRAKVEAGNAPWDVVQVESEELALGCEEGLFQKLDYNRIGGKASYLPAAVSPCGVGAIVYDFVLGYDRDKLHVAPKGWADFFDTKKYPGQARAAPGAEDHAGNRPDRRRRGAAGRLQGARSTEAGVDRAFKKLDTIKPDLICWKAGAQPPQLLASGEVAMTSVYNGRIDCRQRNDKKNFSMVWNGALYTIDSWVILKGIAEHRRRLQVPGFRRRSREPGQAAPNYIAYGVTNKKANALIDAGVPRRPCRPTPVNMRQRATEIRRHVLAGEPRPPDRAVQHLGGEITRRPPRAGMSVPGRRTVSGQDRAVSDTAFPRSSCACGGSNGPASSAMPCSSLPLLLFLVFTFLVPIGTMLWRSVDDPEVAARAAAHRRRAARLERPGAARRGRLRAHSPPISPRPRRTATAGRRQAAELRHERIPLPADGHRPPLRPRPPPRARRRRRCWPSTRAGASWKAGARSIARRGPLTDFYLLAAARPAPHRQRPHRCHPGRAGGVCRCAAAHAEDRLRRHRALPAARISHRLSAGEPAAAAWRTCS